VSETNLSSFNSSLKGVADVPSPDYDGLGPVTLNNVLIMENIEPAITGHLQSPTNNHTINNNNGKTFVNLDSKSWQGGFSTIVTPATVLGETPVFAEIQSNMVPRRSGGRQTGGRRSIIKEEELSPEEEEKLKQRRERNKQAAARCRKRRVDQTTALQNEVDIWEEKKRLLQEEIYALQSQKEELQFILDAHTCTRAPKATTTSDHQQQAFTTNTTQPQTATRSHVLNVPTLAPKVIVKAEVPADPAANNFHLHHLTHEEALNMPTTFASKSVRPARPLSLAIKPQNMRSIEGVPIETPTNVLSSLNFDSLMDGRTGLTPTNVLTPVTITMSLQTPVVTTPNCSSQQRNNSKLSPDNSKPKLVSL